ncbi:hypothetical protein IT411_03680, partial [Candidatus Peregrinibacteria bacterium]|nr:hypothetical protein [Candidatus Peregrinibacteria bacterium]
MIDQNKLKNPDQDEQTSQTSGDQAATNATTSAQSSTAATAAAQPEIKSIIVPKDQLSAEDEAKLESGLAKIQREAKEKDTMEKAAQLGMNYIDIASSPINTDLLKLIPREDAEQNLIFPFYRLGKKLRVTVAHPSNLGTLAIINNLKKQGYLINLNLSSEEGIREALKIYNSDQYKVKKQINTRLDEAKIQTYEKELAD